MKDALGHGSNARGTGAQGMRLVRTHTNGSYAAKVYKNADFGEHVVKFFNNGVYQPKGDYHTDDPQDAHDTAQAQLRKYTATHSEGVQSVGKSDLPRYSPDAVNAAIASQNRSGRGRIGGREARAIHALLKGRH